MPPIRPQTGLHEASEAGPSGHVPSHWPLPRAGQLQGVRSYEGSGFRCRWVLALSGFVMFMIIATIMIFHYHHCPCYCHHHHHFVINIININNTSKNKAAPSLPLSPPPNHHTQKTTIKSTITNT